MSAVAFTIFDSNYRRRAKICLETFASLHPKVQMLYCDLSHRTSVRPFSIGEPLPVESLGLSQIQLSNLAKIYSVTEFSTLLKPWAIEDLLARGFDTVVYLDPDLYWHTPISRDRLFASDSIDIRLTPHLISTEQSNPALDLLKIGNVGVFNLGFGIFHSSSRKFVKLWKEHVTSNAVTAPDLGRFTDQRFMNFAPALSRVETIQDPGYNMAYWNLHERQIVATGADSAVRFLVNDSDLTFFHFSGFDEARAGMLTTHKSDRPCLHLESPGMLALMSSYLGALRRSEVVDTPEPFGFQELSNSRTAPQDLRLALSLGLSEVAMEFGFEEALKHLDNEDFLIHLTTEPEAFGSRVSRVGRILWELRSDVRREIRNPNSQTYVDWLCHHYPDWFSIESDFSPKSNSDATNGTRIESDEFTLLSIASPVLGISSIADYVEAALPANSWRHLRLQSVHHISHNASSMRDTLCALESSRGTSIWCLNPNSLPQQVFESLIRSDRSVTRIGIWWWEIETPPAEWEPFVEWFDEVWVFSKFVYDSLSCLRPDKFRLAPLPVTPPSIGLEESNSLGQVSESRMLRFLSQAKASGKFIVLSKLDFLSSFDRKGIVSSVKAFQQAFAGRGDCLLLIKSTNAKKSLGAVAKLSREIGDVENVLMFDESLSKIDNQRVFNLVDVYLSLHRSEGLGLNILEAICHGTPTIATAYGGFMEITAGLPIGTVPYTLQRVGDQAGLYQPRGKWASPDISTASMLLGRYHQNQVEVNKEFRLASATLRGRLETSTHHFRSFVVNRTRYLSKRGRIQQSPPNSTPAIDRSPDGLPNPVTSDRMTKYDLAHLSVKLEADLPSVDFDNEIKSQNVIRLKLRSVVRRLTKSNREYARHVAKSAILIQQQTEVDKKV